MRDTYTNSGRSKQFKWRIFGSDEEEEMRYIVEQSIRSTLQVR